MSDERCRITVVGERGRVDLAVPARAPIAEYVPMLAGMCGQADSDAMPAAWSLAPAGGRPFEPETSLEAVGVLDGDTLYLRDVLEGGFDGPVVADVDERVAEIDDDGVTWNARARARTTLGLGLLIVLVGAVALSTGADGAAGPGPLLFATGLVFAVVAWVAGAQSWPVPAVLRLALAIATCPILGLAALALPLSGVTAQLVAVSITASIGAFAAYLAAPAIATMVLQIACGLAMVLVVPLAALRADPVEASAVVGVVLFLILTVLPRTAAQVAALPPGPVEADDVEAAVVRVRRLLGFLTAVCCVVLGACLVVLSTSRDWFALGLALCLSLALLCRAGAWRPRTVVGALLLTGAAGLVALALRAPGLIEAVDVPGWAGPLAVLVAGAIVVWSGLVMCFRSSLQQADFDERWSWPGGVATFLSAVSVPLAAGVFGVFGDLMRAGGKL
ncbi:type VII secretion integral membrane protein EccD [Actinomadura sp. DC4]|uniref:type VII secretion integral membrane protein EccD n=1 Tax=Actinomadura sp. DC4 TaxID=3055069 RepID=UPI0025AF4818|nr:type VII secretion integral membrane protein EccD [Actinomadura sp. DC4]MDN3354933.1 type VII secretion integral membrane protein EccD [Actinomadura sp. DC4]